MAPINRHHQMNTIVELFNEYQDPAEAQELFEQMRNCLPAPTSPEDAVAYITRFRRQVGPMVVDGHPTCLCANVWEACHQIEVMGRRRLRWAVPLLTRLLYHQDPDFDTCPEYAVHVQAAAARALGAIGDMRAIPPLLAKLDEGPTYAPFSEGTEDLAVLRVELDDAVVAAVEALDTLGANLVDGGRSSEEIAD